MALVLNGIKGNAEECVPFTSGIAKGTGDLGRPSMASADPLISVEGESSGSSLLESQRQ